MFLKKILFSITLLFPSICQGIIIQQNQAIVLEEFFRTMLLQSEGGYVLLDQKPVCINGFYVVDKFYGENESHKEFVNLRVGAEVWKNFSSLNNDNILIHIKNKEDSEAKNYFHILFINKKLFLHAVQNNITLFQYILGPSVTPEELLKKLTDPNETFHSVLNNNNVLIGIILGFGTQNSLYGSRIELLQQYLQFTEHPPLRNELLENQKIKHFRKEDILFQGSTHNLSALNLKPSFSYSSIKEEINDLLKQMDISSKQLSQNRPYFIFGKLNADKETAAFINILEKTQNEINLLLSSKSFLRDVLHKIFPQEKIEIIVDSPNNTNTTFPEKELELLPTIVAMNILDNIPAQNDEFLQGLILGMKDSEANLEKRFNKPIEIYRKLEILKTAQDNINQADLYFAKLEEDKRFTCIAPKKLYYQCLEEGWGKKLDNQAKVMIHCKIETPKSLAIIDTWKNNEPMEINLNHAIQGFILGMENMKIGELREILIHPSLGYGIYTLLEKGIYLKAKVKLLSFDSEIDLNKHLPISSYNFDEDLNFLKNNDFNEASKIEGYLQGYNIWTHYKKAKLYSLKEILKIIDLDKFDKYITAYESKEHQDLLNRLHWQIYQNSN